MRHFRLVYVSMAAAAMAFMGYDIAAALLVPLVVAETVIVLRKKKRREPDLSMNPLGALR